MMHKKIRYWIINKLLSNDEKWLVYFALDTRQKQYVKDAIMEKTIITEDAKQDIEDIITMKKTAFKFSKR